MGELASIHAWGHIPERLVRPNGVVFLLLNTDDAIGMVERIELVHAETFVTDFPFKGFHEAVFPGLAWRDEAPFCFTSPLGNSVTDEFRTVIHAGVPSWRLAQWRAGQIVQRGLAQWSSSRQFHPSIPWCVRRSRRGPLWVSP